jgi:hypothetical protein
LTHGVLNIVITELVVGEMTIDIVKCGKVDYRGVKTTLPLDGVKRRSLVFAVGLPSAHHLMRSDHLEDGLRMGQRCAELRWTSDRDGWPTLWWLRCTVAIVLEAPLYRDHTVR